MPRCIWRQVQSRLRNIKLGHPVFSWRPGGKPYDIIKVGDIERRGSCRVVCNLEGRGSKVWDSELHVELLAISVWISVDGVII